MNETTPSIGNFHPPVLMGEVITFASGGVVPYSLVKAGLASCGLPDVAKDMLPRSAFTRGARKLCKERIFTKIKEDDAAVWYQFNTKQANGDHIDLPLEAVIVLDKSTGSLLCANAEIEHLAQTEMDAAMVTRTSNDVTKIVQKLFEDRAGLWAIRDQGGAYFVPIAHQEFTANVERFLLSLGGRMRRFPVPEGTKEGKAAVKDTLASGLDKLLAEHEAVMNEFTDETRTSTMESLVQKMQRTRLQIEAHATYIEEKRADLLAKYDVINKAAMAKIAAKQKETQTEAA